jgi:hypothetical protein
VALVVAPIKLYGIHDELRKTNRTLAAQNEILTAIATEMHFAALPLNVDIIRPAPPTPPALPVLSRDETVWELPRSPRDLA